MSGRASDAWNIALAFGDCTLCPMCTRSVTLCCVHKSSSVIRQSGQAGESLEWCHAPHGTTRASHTPLPAPPGPRLARCRSSVVAQRRTRTNAAWKSRTATERTWRRVSASPFGQQELHHPCHTCSSRPPAGPLAAGLTALRTGPLALVGPAPQVWRRVRFLECARMFRVHSIKGAHCTIMAGSMWGGRGSPGTHFPVDRSTTHPAGRWTAHEPGVPPGFNAAQYLPTHE